MTAVFVSNFLNHHQIPICDEFVKLFDEFSFISVDNGDEQGYQKSCEKSYLVDYKTEKETAENLVCEADVVIFGSAPNELIKMRMEKNKLSLIYSERFFKRSTLLRFYPRTRKSIENRITDYKNKNLFVICASAFLPYDLSFFKYPKEKCFKWGYFPDCDVIEKDLIKNKKDNSILWAGRMLDWKHPEIAVEVARKLKSVNVDFVMNIVGDGPEKQKLENLIEKYELKDKVNLLGSLSHEELLDLMKEHKIYMFTSDFNEGWGAVLNEAMGSGCAVVASSAIGSVPFLIEDCENGRIYSNGNIEQAYLIVKELVKNPDKCIEYGNKAADSIAEKYNYKIAAERLFEFCEKFLRNGELPQYEEGILSPVRILKNNWF